MGTDGLARHGALLGVLVAFLACFFSPVSLSQVPGASSLSTVLSSADQAYRMGSFDAAEGFYQKLLGTAHEKTAVRRLLEIAVRLGDWTKASRWAKHESVAGEADSAFWSAQIQLGEGKRSHATAALERFIALHKSHPLVREAHLTLAALAIDDGQLARARELLEPYSRAEDGAKVDFLKARLQARIGTKESQADAIHRLERMRQNPGGLPLDWLAKVYFELGALRLAAQQFESVGTLTKDYFEKFPDDLHQRDALELLGRAGGFNSPQKREQWLTWSMTQSAAMQASMTLQLAKAEAADGILVEADRKSVV